MSASADIARVVALTTPSRVMTRMAASRRASRRSPADIRVIDQPSVACAPLCSLAGTRSSGSGHRPLGPHRQPRVLVVLVEGPGERVVLAGTQVLRELVVGDRAGGVGAVAGGLLGRRGVALRRRRRLRVVGAGVVARRLGVPGLVVGRGLGHGRYLPPAARPHTSTRTTTGPADRYGAHRGHEPRRPEGTTCRST